eukprot:1637533-Heterocapsa_arctica.AAC.1
MFACSDCPSKGARCESPFECDITVAALAGEDVSMSDKCMEAVSGRVVRSSTPPRSSRATEKSSAS